MLLCPEYIYNAHRGAVFDILSSSCFPKLGQMKKSGAPLECATSIEGTCPNFFPERT